MEAKISKIENSLVVVLPDEMAAHLQVEEGGNVIAVKGEDAKLELWSTKTQFGRTMGIAADIMRRYHNTLRALAD